MTLNLVFKLHAGSAWLFAVPLLIAPAMNDGSGMFQLTILRPANTTPAKRMPMITAAPARFGVDTDAVAKAIQRSPNSDAERVQRKAGRVYRA